MTIKAVMTDAEFKELLKTCPGLRIPPYRKTRGQASGIGVNGLVRQLKAVMAKPKSEIPSVDPDVTIPHNQLPYRHRFSDWAIQMGYASQEIVDRHETGCYPTLEEHLAGTSPKSTPFLSPLQFFTS
jgi:hypothetical protein